MDTTTHRDVASRKHGKPAWQECRVHDLLQDARAEGWSIETTSVALAEIGEEWADFYVADALGLGDPDYEEDLGDWYASWLAKRDPTARKVPGVIVADDVPIRTAVALIAEAGRDGGPDDRGFASLARHVVEHGHQRECAGRAGARPSLDPREGGGGRLTAALVAEDPSLVHCCGWVIYPYQGVAHGHRAIAAHEWAEKEGQVIDPVWGDAGPRVYLGCPVSEDVFTNCGTPSLTT